MGWHGRNVVKIKPERRKDVESGLAGASAHKPMGNKEIKER